MVFERNVKILKRCNPGLAERISMADQGGEIHVFDSASGRPTVLVSNQYIHSEVDPVSEAAKWVADNEKDINRADNIVVFGFGLGYHILELCKVTKKKITVFEPDRCVLRAAFQCMDLEEALLRVHICTEHAVPDVTGDTAVLVHHPSYGVNPDYYGDILERLNVKDILGKGLRIMVVGPVFGGSLDVAKYCSTSLIDMGHDVELVDNSRFEDTLFYIKEIAKNPDQYNALVDQLTRLLSECIMTRFEDFKPHIVLALAQAPLTPESLDRMRQYGVKTAYWFVEDFRFMEYWKKTAPHVDYFFTIQKDEFSGELRKAGLHNYHYLPMAAFPKVHNRLQMSEEETEYYRSDVSFVGAGYYNRRHFFSGLIDYDLKIWGTDWDMNSRLAEFIQRSGRRVDTDEIVKIYNASTINVNLHSSSYHKSINPFGDFVNPRTFEILSCGGFQLVDRRSGLDGLFEEDEEIVIFDDLNDLRQKIEYYLQHPDKARAVAEKGRARVLRDHTYKIRMQEMLELIVSGGLETELWDEGRQSVAELTEQAGHDTELGRLLTRLSGRERINLDDIIEEISQGEGDISRPETLFMLMKEFAG